MVNESKSVTMNVFVIEKRNVPNGSTSTTSMNSQEVVRSNEGSKGKDNTNEVVRNVWQESTSGKSVSNQKADRSKDERDMIISSNDYEIGEASEICQPYTLC